MVSPDSDLRQDSMASKEVDVRDGTESATEDVETGSRTSDASHIHGPRDPEKAASQTAPGEPLQRTVTAQDWTGPDDPENPLNWSFGKKAYHTAVTAYLGFSVTCGSSLITPATPEISERFNVSRTASILALSLFVLGLAVGPVIAAPISETYGRSVVYKVSSVTFMFFILGAGFSNSLGSLLVCRFLASTLGGPVLAVGAGTNGDMYAPKDRAIASSLFVMMPFLGPSVGPVIGGFAAQYMGWRWTQWCTIFIAIVVVVPVMFMSETYKKIVLARRAKRLNIEPPQGMKLKGWAWWKFLLTVTLARPLHMLFTEPTVFLFSLYTAFTFSVLFAFFAAYPFTFQSVYGFNTWQYGLTFLAIGLGVILGVATTIVVDRLYYMKQHQRVVKEGRSAVPPEYRLLNAQMGCFGIPIGLFWFAWSARSDVHWISPVLAGIPFAWGNVCIFVSAALYFIDTYGPLNGASAMAANGVARYTLGAVFPLFTFQMYSRLGIGWATSLLAFISVGMLPIPWLFYKYGPKIRAKSQYDTMKF